MKNFNNNYLIPILEKELTEITISDKLTSENQKHVANNFAQ